MTQPVRPFYSMARLSTIDEVARWLLHEPSHHHPAPVPHRRGRDSCPRRSCGSRLRELRRRRAEPGNGVERPERQHAGHRQRGQGRHPRPGGELGQRVHLARPEPLQPPAAAQFDRHWPAAGPGVVVEDRVRRPDVHLQLARGRQVLQRHARHRQRRRVLDQAIARVQWRLGLPADGREDDHRAGRAHSRDHAVRAARAAARRPGDVRLLGGAGETGPVAGVEVLPAPGRQRPVHGDLVQPGQ